MLVFLVAGAIVSTVFFGLAPALQATRLELVRTMRGEVTRDARPGRARHALIAVQVGASALLLICAAIFLRGAFAAAMKDPGMRTSDTVRVSIETEPRRAAMLQDADGPSVGGGRGRVVADDAWSRRNVRVRRSGQAAVRRSLGEGGSRMSVDQLAVSSDYFDVLGIEVVSGRGFTQAERTAERASRSCPKPSRASSGRMARRSGRWCASTLRNRRRRAHRALVCRSTPRGVEPSRTLTVIGVVRDPGRASGVYLPTGPESPGTWLYLRVRGNPEQARLALLERLTGLDPGFGIMTLRTMAGMQTYLLQIAFWVTVVLGGLALVLTVSGLFSVLSYVVEQQAKEIGVRMALGATTRDVAGLVLSQSLRPVGIGLVAGGGLAAAVAIVLMATPAASEIGDTVQVFDPVAYAASLLVIVTSCVLAVSVPALRAARIDPIATLRRD